MQFESHANPIRESPAQRYAALHRAIDRGLEADGVWRELANVCLELGFTDEAARCIKRLQSPAARLALEARLQRHHGLSSGHRPAPAQHPAAPAASNAGTHTEPSSPVVGTPPRDRLHGLGEHVIDAVQYLGQQHLPWLVLLCTLAFPLVIGLGGLLTGGESPWLVGALQSLPGLAVFAIVGAMARRILRDSAAGEADVPRLGTLGALTHDACRCAADTGLVVGALLGPGLLAAAAGAPWTTTLPSLGIGAYFLPLALGLRQVRGDLAALSPVTLLRGTMRTGLAYPALALLQLLMFLPAATATWLVQGRPLWVQIAALGPLYVLPLFLAARLLGTWLDGMRLELGSVLTAAKAPATRSATRAAAAPLSKAATPRQLRRPEQLAHFDAPPAAPRPAPAPRRKAAKQASPAAQQTPRAIEGRAPAREPAAPAIPPVVASQDLPDLSHMPGATVVSGADRARHGAASRR